MRHPRRLSKLRRRLGGRDASALAGDVVVRIGLVLLCMTLALAGVSAHVELERKIQLMGARIAAEPADATLYLQRGELHRLHQAWAAAWADFDRAEALDPELGVLPLCRAQLVFDTGDAGRALERVEALCAERPDWGLAWRLAARCLDALDRTAEAAAAWRRAVQTLRTPSPDDVLAAARRTQQSGAPEQALALLEASRERLGGSLPLDLEALTLERSLARSADALRRLERLAAASDRAESWLAVRGDVLVEAGHLAAAREAYEQARRLLDARPDHVRSRPISRQLEQHIDAELARLQPGVAAR